MKRVLIITYYWPPSGGPGVQRWLKFAKYLPDFDVTPVVLTVKPENAEYPIIDESLNADISPDLEVRRTASKGVYDWYKKMTGNRTAPYSGFANEGNPSLLQKIARFIRGNFFLPDARRGWIKYAFREASKIIEQQGIQTVITTGPPHSTHLTGLKLKKKYGIRWIADFRDPWTTIYYNHQMYQTGIAKKIDKFYENKVFANCDFLTLVADNREQLRITPHKAVFLPNGYDEKDFAEPPNTVSSKFHIRYLGTMASNYPISALFKALSECRFDFQIHFTGKTSEDIEISGKHLLGEKFACQGFVSHQEAIDSMMSASILLLVIPRSSDNQGILTGKLFEYLAAGRPVLLLGPTDGKAAQIIREANAGEAFDYEDVQGIKDFLTEQYQTTQNYPSDKVYIRQFSRKALTGKLAKLI